MTKFKIPSMPKHDKKMIKRTIILAMYRNKMTKSMVRPVAIRAKIPISGSCLYKVRVAKRKSSELKILEMFVIFSNSLGINSVRFGVGTHRLSIGVLEYKIDEYQVYSKCIHNL